MTPWEEAAQSTATQNPWDEAKVNVAGPSLSPDVLAAQNRSQSLQNNPEFSGPLKSIGTGLATGVNTALGGLPNLGAAKLLQMTRPDIFNDTGSALKYINERMEKFQTANPNANAIGTGLGTVASVMGPGLAGKGITSLVESQFPSLAKNLGTRMATAAAPNAMIGAGMSGIQTGGDPTAMLTGGIIGGAGGAAGEALATGLGKGMNVLGEKGALLPFTQYDTGTSKALGTMARNTGLDSSGIYQAKEDLANEAKKTGLYQMFQSDKEKANVLDSATKDVGSKIQPFYDNAANMGSGITPKSFEEQFKAIPTIQNLLANPNRNAAQISDIEKTIKDFQDKAKLISKPGAPYSEMSVPLQDARDFQQDVSHGMYSKATGRISGDPVVDQAADSVLRKNLMNEVNKYAPPDQTLSLADLNKRYFNLKALQNADMNEAKKSGNEKPLEALYQMVKDQIVGPIFNKIAPALQSPIGQNLARYTATTALPSLADQLTSGMNQNKVQSQGQ